MTDRDRRKQRLGAFIRQVWDEGDADAADGYIAEAYTIHHDPGDPWEGRTLDRAGFKEREFESRERPFPTNASISTGCSPTMMASS
jgi:hypothetical protein